MPCPACGGSPQRRAVSSQPSTPDGGRRHVTTRMLVGLQALAESMLYITVRDLLAHGYDRVAIQYSHDQGVAGLVDQRRPPAPMFAAVPPLAFQREAVAAVRGWVGVSRHRAAVVCAGCYRHISRGASLAEAASIVAVDALNRAREWGLLD